MPDNQLCPASRSKDISVSGWSKYGDLSVSGFDDCRQVAELNVLLSLYIFVYVVIYYFLLHCFML